MSVTDLTPVRAAVAPAGVAVALERVSRQFGDTVVLDKLDLRVAPGEFLAIVGRSGSGKSSLLRILCGLDDPSAGRVLFDGSPASPGIARMMFQEPRLLPWTRVLDNVAVGLGGATTPEARTRALDALRAVGLDRRAADWPTVLSGGQKQRVALARALVSRPQLLLLDEPLGALDALTRLEMQALVETVWREQGFTAVLVTHDVAEAVRLADRIVVLEGGAVTLDLPNPAPRPRGAVSPAAADLEETILRRLMRAA